MSIKGSVVLRETLTNSEVKVTTWLCDQVSDRGGYRQDKRRGWGCSEGEGGGGGGGNLWKTWESS